MLKEQIINKVKGLVGIANKAGYLVIGADNLKNDRKKLFLVIRASDCGNGIEKVCAYSTTRTNCNIIVLQNDILQHIIGIDTCKVFGIRNKGISDQIIELLRGDSIGK